MIGYRIEYLDQYGKWRGIGTNPFISMGDLPYPRVSTKPKTKFWFTPYGWEKYRKTCISQCKRSKLTIRILQTRMCGPSYKDRFQFAQSI